MQRRSALKWWFIAAVVVVIGFVAFCSLLFTLLAIDDAKNAALKSTDQLLSVAASHPTGALPKNDIPSQLWVDEECWTRLQGAIAKNVNRYITEVTHNSDDVPNISHAHEEVGITVIFSDGERILIDYFQRSWLGCR